MLHISRKNNEKYLQKEFCYRYFLGEFLDKLVSEVVKLLEEDLKKLIAEFLKKKT